MKIFNFLATWKQSSVVIALLIGHLVFASVFILRERGIVQNFELYSYDFLLWTRPSALTSDPRITLVLVNDEDQRRWSWPLPDKQLGQLLSTILQHKPIVIGLDIYRDQPVPNDECNNANYEHLLTLLKNHLNIIGIRKHQDNGVYVKSLPVFEGTDRIGFNDLSTDPGGTIIRRGLLYMGDNQGNVFESFGLKLALSYLATVRHITPKQVPNNPAAIKLNQAILIPLPKNFGGYVNEDLSGFQIMLDYPTAPYEFNQVNLTDILTEQFNPTLFRNRIVIIGTSAQATPDFAYVPYARWLAGDQRTPGAAIHAYIVSQLLDMALGDSRPIQSLNETEELAWIWVWSILGALISSQSLSIWRFGLSALGGLMILGLSSYLAFLYKIWLIIAAPALAWILAAVVMTAYLSYKEKSQRTMLMHLFSKHVSKDIAAVIWQEREQYMNAGRLRSQRITATVLFTDLQNFTTVSEQMEPQALMDWLNQYMEAMVNIVEKQHHGQVNKFIGDAVMAVFGVPVPSMTPEAIARDATNAVECALSMRREIEHLREVWQAQGLPLIRMRVGIFTGALVAGSLGGVERQEYTVIGDTVNTASRLESFDKSVDTNSVCRILIGESTLQLLNGQFNTERVGEVYLKGKQQGVTIHRVIGQVFKAPPEMQPLTTYTR